MRKYAQCGPRLTSYINYYNIEKLEATGAFPCLQESVTKKGNFSLLTG